MPVPPLTVPVGRTIWLPSKSDHGHMPEKHKFKRQAFLNINEIEEYLSNKFRNLRQIFVNVQDSNLGERQARMLLN